MVVCLAACSGGVFRVEAPLSRTAALPVAGTFGMATVCNAHEGHRGSDVGMMGDKPADVVLGGWVGRTSVPHRELSTERLFGEAILNDYKAFLERYDLPRLSKAATALPGMAGAHDLVAGIAFLLLLPGKSTETVRFTFFAADKDRSVAIACATTEIARTFGFFDGPRFSMTCRAVPTADGAARDLRVWAEGTWANYRFLGELRGPEGTNTFASQNVSILGAGAVRGFEFRAAGQQQAAISFWQVPDSEGKRYMPKAWVAEGLGSPPLRDVIHSILALSYIFPWPTSCEDQQLRNKGMKSIEPQLKAFDRKDD
jgi:hypothetical protein